MIPSVSRMETVVPVGCRLNRVSAPLLAVLVAVLASWFSPSVVQSQPPCTPEPKLVVTVGDTLGSPCEANSVITVSLQNISDTIAGFTLLLRLDRLDLVRFNTDYDTVVDTSKWDCTLGTPPNCTDSVALDKNSPTWDMRYIDTQVVQIADIDTTGTALSGWQFVQTRDFSGQGSSILITALADQIGPPVKPPLLPSGSQRVLFRLRGDILCNIPDTLSDRTVKVLVEDNFIDRFLFSKPNGTTIGTWTEQVLDTVCWECLNYIGSTCVNWHKISTGPCDSTSTQILQVLRLDTCYVKAFDGSLTVLETCCINGTTGNADNDPGDNVDISDLQVYIDFLFFGGPAGVCINEFNSDADPGQNIDITDLQVIIDFLFFGGSLAGC